VALAACGDTRPPADAPGPPLAFTGATLWDGTGALPLGDAVLLVRGGRIEAVGRRSDLSVPDDAEVVDLAGLWVVPGLVNAHGHVGQALGLSSGPGAHTVENIEDQLALYARYGVTTVVSLGEPGFFGVEVRRAQEEDARRPDGPTLDRARLRVAGEVLNPATPEEAGPAVRALAAEGVDWAKIRVDDGLGTRNAMSRETYAAVIAAAHAEGLPLTAHLVYLDDARGLVEEGADVLGHSVRDALVDEATASAMRTRGVCLHPTLTRELSTFVYASRPDFFDDPFFLRDADPEVLARLEDPEMQARYTGRAADWYRDQLPVATQNMVLLHDAGVRIAFGTDSGPPARFQGYFEHLELEMMQEAGLPPDRVLLAATSVAAECMRLEGIGSLVPGAWADFLVLRESPLDDVRNLRQIEEVRIAGNVVPGARFEGR
jgi:imidazolonepropionase-like amidohydrolase